MSNIEVGEYVRTLKGDINKVIGIRKESRFITNTGRPSISPERYFIDNAKKYSISKPYVKKHSFDIIDLIEVGDYVNGCEVIMTYCYDENGNDKDRLGITETDMDYAWYKDLQDINIYSIVTKEQFKEMEYKVNE